MAAPGFTPYNRSGLLEQESELRDASLREAYRYWLARRNAEGGVPWDSIAISDFKPVLDRVSLADVVGDPPRFFLRVVGTYWRDHTGFEGTRTWLDEWPDPEARNRLLSSYRQTVQAGRPFHALRAGLVDGRVLIYEALLLPIGPRPDRTERLLIVLAPIADEDGFDAVRRF